MRLFAVTNVTPHARPVLITIARLTRPEEGGPLLGRLMSIRPFG
jgi:hypothetical protein